MNPRVDLRARALSHLAWLVAADTRNPPRRTHASGVMPKIADALGASFDVRIDDHGDGAVNLFAVRGRPRVLFNFHVDTVPDNPAWTRDPFVLHVDGDRAAGLGACDIKGALAAMLAAIETTGADAAILVSSDEEAGRPRCVPEFLATSLASVPFVDGVVVAEPTSCAVVSEHRGFASGTAHFSGVPGHGSEARALADSAVHALVRWGAKVLDAVERGALGDVRFNLGRVEGGQKSNVIAASATARFGLRTAPTVAPETVLARVQEYAAGKEARWETGMIGAPLPGPTPPAAWLHHARDCGAKLDAPAARAVDFWTEGALFSAAGLPAVVFGPGAIEQAHTADEWVSIHELERAALAYARFLSS